MRMHMFEDFFGGDIPAPKRVRDAAETAFKRAKAHAEAGKCAEALGQFIAGALKLGKYKNECNYVRSEFRLVWDKLRMYFHEEGKRSEDTSPLGWRHRALRRRVVVTFRKLAHETGYGDGPLKLPELILAFLSFRFTF